MAKKASQSAEPKKRIRRTAEQMIADLQAEIERVKTRAATKEMKASPAAKCLLQAIRAIDSGLNSDDADGALKHTLADSRKPLAAYCEGNGLRLPKPRMPRGRRPGS